MQHRFVCLQGTFGDHPGGINKNSKQNQDYFFLIFYVLVILPLYIRGSERFL